MLAVAFVMLRSQLWIVSRHWLQRKSSPKAFNFPPRSYVLLCPFSPRLIEITSIFVHIRCFHRGNGLISWKREYFQFPDVLPIRMKQAALHRLHVIKLWYVVGIDWKSYQLGALMRSFLCNVVIQQFHRTIYSNFPSLSSGRLKPKQSNRVRWHPGRCLRPNEHRPSFSALFSFFFFFLLVRAVYSLSAILKCWIDFQVWPHDSWAMKRWHIRWLDAIEANWNARHRRRYEWRIKLGV